MTPRDRSDDRAAGLGAAGPPVSPEHPASVEIGSRPLGIADVVAVARGKASVVLTASTRDVIARGRTVVDRAVASGNLVYGVSTGLGALSDTRISADDRQILQANLLRSHAAGTGAPFADDVVRAALLLRAHALALGYSGVRPVVVERLLALLNAGIVPLVPCQGSVGASGDLAPLAHLALPLVGEGRVRVGGVEMAAGAALAAAGLSPLTLEAKEALALINGTQITAAVAALAVHDAETLFEVAQIAAAMSFDALGGHVDALSDQIQRLRPHPGQMAVAGRMRELLSRGGTPPVGGRRAVQDRYSLRCIPQVLGPVLDALGHVRRTVEVEINSVTDNPLCFPDSGEVISGGNFHGHPLALTCDYLAVAVASLGAFTERRIFTLVDPAASGLPAFLTPSPGTNSGFMIAQYVAASLASENKVLAHPASVDSIPTSAGIEDYNSMSTIAARHLAQIVDNVARIVAIELVCAGQALDLQPGDIRSTAVSAAHGALRRRVAFLPADDREMHTVIGAALDALWSGEMPSAVRDALRDASMELPEGEGR